MTQVLFFRPQENLPWTPKTPGSEVKDPKGSVKFHSLTFFKGKGKSKGKGKGIPGSLLF